MLSDHRNHLIATGMSGFLQAFRLPRQIAILLLPDTRDSGIDGASRSLWGSLPPEPEDLLHRNAPLVPYGPHRPQFPGFIPSNQGPNGDA